MAEYISKSALVAEIERRKNQFMSQADNFHSLGMEEKRDHFAVLASNMHSILSFLDTLEVKEVDLEKEIERVIKIIHENHYTLGIGWTQQDAYDIAKHFFELGMSVSIKAQKGENI